MEILKAMSIKTNEFSKGLILRGLCRLHTAVPYVFEVIRKKDKYYLCIMDPQYVGASLVGELSDNYCICDYEEITDLTVKGVFNKIIYFINYYNKEDGYNKQLAYI
jgi:hypothetical protein